MITEDNIKMAIVEQLKGLEYKVYATEIKEGFKKPCCFVSVYPHDVEKQCSGMELVTDQVEIQYIPSIETTEECAQNAQKLRKEFCYQPIKVKDRRLTIETAHFEIEDYVLYMTFSLSYYQQINEIQENETMEKLEFTM